MKDLKVRQKDQVQVRPGVLVNHRTLKVRSISNKLLTCSSRLWKLWLSFQVSHRGKYSVERMLALDEYTRSTSPFRVLIVCLVTPLPMLIIVFLQESVPLAAPGDGWCANYGFWIRMAILGGTVSASLLMELQLRIASVRISPCAFSVLVCSSSAVFTGLGIYMAVMWIFPVPFINLFVGSQGVSVMMGLVRVVCGQRTWNRIVKRRELFARVFLLLAADILTACVYLAYTSVFRAANHTSSISFCLSHLSSSRHYDVDLA
ncbi:unnamed protein product [Phytophthora fragariaefolia]|uniref:Unnamed protein product n=1 Tax=Phytophthora fragariaefolia TaxID=1490495 RepID=A0A9W6Y048_9STRA|nr:unnamed protein product [Phytophthora fragariaefolia]